MTITPNTLAAAHRARIIASIARTRALSPALADDTAARTALGEIADLLNTAADVLERDESTTWDGVLITNTMDFDATHAFLRADAIAEATPTTGFPPHFTQYATAPVFRNDVDLPASLLPGGVVLIAREGDLFVRLLAVNAELAANLTGVDDRTTVNLDAAFDLLWKHAQLAQSIAAATEPGHDAGIPAPDADEPPTA
jgi:hypothetical protein